jgi:hypothetical protein
LRFRLARRGARRAQEFLAPVGAGDSEFGGEFRLRGDEARGVAGQVGFPNGRGPLEAKMDA